VAGEDHASATYGSQCVATSALTGSPVYEQDAGAVTPLGSAVQGVEARQPHPRIGPGRVAQAAV